MISSGEAPQGQFWWKLKDLVKLKEINKKLSNQISISDSGREFNSSGPLKFIFGSVFNERLVLVAEGPGLAARPGDLEAGPSLSRPQFTHPYKGGNHGPPSPRTYGGDRMGECKLNVLGTVKYYMYTKLIKKKQH